MSADLRENAARLPARASVDGSAAPALPVPPRPRRLPALLALARVVARGNGDLLSLLPANAYRVPIGTLGWSRRKTVIVNAPDLVRQVLNDADGLFPKSDLMVGALAPLVGDSMFVSGGATWQRQRRMLDPAFTHMRVSRAFDAMDAAIDAFDTALAARAEVAAPLSLDLLMSHLTADVICRTVFSQPLQSAVAHEVFEAFAVFERSVGQVRLRRLIFDPAGTPVPQQPAVLDACGRIRRHLGTLLDPHLADPHAHDDIAADIVAGRDPDTGTGFTREELLDQLGVMFLAGHETTASGLTWALYLLATQPRLAARLRAEVQTVAGDAPLTIEHVKRLAFVRNVFRETLRLYPPITFLPRMAARATTLGGMKLPVGALVMVAPWTLHRHADHWKAPDAFDPDRWSSAREHELVPGTYIPFGQGPRVCVGAAFATTEATLVLARLLRDYTFEVLDPQRVRPAARLTTRPAEQIMVRVARR